jgi:hypothetical protein
VRDRFPLRPVEIVLEHVFEDATPERAFEVASGVGSGEHAVEPFDAVGLCQSFLPARAVRACRVELVAHRREYSIPPRDLDVTSVAMAATMEQ